MKLSGSKTNGRINVLRLGNGGLNMRWLLIIVLAIAVEFFVRFLTRNMEDKKKRERLLALIWFAFGAILVVVWVIKRFL